MSCRVPELPLAPFLRICGLPLVHIDGQNDPCLPTYWIP